MQIEASGYLRPSPFRVSCFLVPGFSMLALSSAIEPLRSVNLLLGEERYRWRVVSSAKGPVSASNGLEVRAEYDLDDPPETDLTLVVASLGLGNYADRKLLTHVRWLSRHGELVGAVSNGAIILAKAGIVGGRRITIHWESLDKLSDMCPDAHVRSELFCFDGTILTAAGGAAAMDMMLELIALREGRNVAIDVAEQFVHGVIRPASDAQRLDPTWRYRLTDPRLETAIRIMIANLSRPLRIARLAEIAEVSERQLERLFHKSLGATPSAFYLNLRLENAHMRTIGTTDSLEAIADVTGFSSQAHFSRAFKTRYGVSPKAVRDRRRAMDVGQI